MGPHALELGTKSLEESRVISQGAGAAKSDRNLLLEGARIQSEFSNL